MSRKPRDHVRLARAFDVPLTRVGTAVGVTATMGLFALASPLFWLPMAGAVAAGFGGVAAVDRRAIAKALREVDELGFPVEGYRAWLLADDPALDIELKRDVDLEVVRTSTAAVDASITVEKRGDRVFRFVMPRIALPNRKPHLPPIEVGDRRLLFELHRRILGPLHADVGIVAMRMGDNATLAALVASGPSSEPVASSSLVGLGAFRESALAAPPALQALVHVGGDRAMPREARRLDRRAERVLHAANASPRGVGSVLAISLGGAMATAQFGPEAMLVGSVVGFFGGIGAVVSGNRRSAKSIGAAVANAGFPIEDYEDWLISGRPLFDIVTSAPIPRTWFLANCAKLTAHSVTANATVAWVEDVTWFSDTEVRIETRPTYVQPPTSRIDPFYGGSHDMFRTFMFEVLAPLHAQTTIQVVRMGGYIDRRI